MSWLQNYDPLHNVELSTAVLSQRGADVVGNFGSLQAYSFPFTEIVVK